MKRPIWKVKRGGKQIGSFHFTAPGGLRINTRTDDANKALKFRARWLEKHPAPQKTEVQGAAAATIAALDATPDLDPPESETPSPPDLPAAGSVAPPALQADYIPPPRPDTGNWADDAARAAAGSGPAEPTEPDLDPAFLKDLLEDAAAMLVVLQIKAQEWAIAQGVELKAAVVPNDNRGRAKGKEIWIKQLLLWAPDDFDLPGWLAAPIAVAAGTLPVQLGEGCMPLPKKEARPDGSQATATSEAVGVAE